MVKIRNLFKKAKNAVTNFFASVDHKVNALVVSAMSILAAWYVNARKALANQYGEGYVDSGVKILIAVVIGALLLAGLYTLFKDTVIPTVTQKVQALFNYAG